MHNKFSVKKINQLRRKAERICEPVNDMLLEEQKWTFINFEPVNLLKLFSSLKLKEGFVLKAYLYRTNGNGNGRIFAYPAVAAHHLDHYSAENNFFYKKPELALENLMDAIDGDGSPWSYLSASLFAREAAEFGALWHGVNWGNHRIIEKDPTGTDEALMVPAPDAEWQWLQARPKSWLPLVIQKPGKVTVKFYSHSEYITESIYEHTVIYQPFNYTAVESIKKRLRRGRPVLSIKMTLTINKQQPFESRCPDYSEA
ncbi:hypothetical protein [Paenibacillus humicola]|uniref:hypothetical protein n=1 Tax=Paenibacillus humicola TaxID=3110540 RepID=UPI00237AEB62|nr:hypothetical protein [Paenibacillus humicola]